MDHWLEQLAHFAEDPPPFGWRLLIPLQFDDLVPAVRGQLQDMTLTVKQFKEIEEGQGSIRFELSTHQLGDLGFFRIRRYHGQSMLQSPPPPYPEHRRQLTDEEHARLRAATPPGLETQVTPAPSEEPEPPSSFKSDPRYAEVDAAYMDIIRQIKAERKDLDDRRCQMKKRIMRDVLKRLIKELMFVGAQEQSAQKDNALQAPPTRTQGKGRPRLEETERVKRLALAQELEEMKARNPEKYIKEIIGELQPKHRWPDSVYSADIQKYIRARTMLKALTASQDPQAHALLQIVAEYRSKIDAQ